MTGSGVLRTSSRRRTCTLFRTLYTNACSSDCAYCTNSAQSRTTYSYTPEELAKVFHHLYVENIAQGLFLSSAMGGEVDRTMEGMLEAVEVLRTKRGFRGYVHLKILPGASYYHVQRAVELADRVSLNVEQPSGDRLSEVCTTKDYETDILMRQTWVTDLSPYPPSGQATQFIVGSTGETDREIITRMHQLYRDVQMRRISYSAFEPIPDTRLEPRQATPAWRQHRLYQVDWLYRVYRYPV